MSPGFKSARIDLKLSGQGNFGVGITKPASELPNSISLRRPEKISGTLGINSSLGPAVHEGGKQSDTPFVGRTRLFDLVLSPTSIHDSCTFARGSNRWTMAAQHTSRPRPGTTFCLIYFLSLSLIHI